MSRDFQGRGWRFPVGVDYNGDIALSSGETDIEEAVRIIVGTAKGERLMRPEFGCDIHDHVFATVDATTLNLIETDVRDALTTWEPRIDVEDVTARPDDRDPEVVAIHVDYVVRSTNSRGNLVYPFYLEEG